MRLANWRSASAGMASSFSATRNQDGCDFHAGRPITSSNVDAARGLRYRKHDPRPDRIDVPGEVAAVGVPGDDGRAVLTVEGLASTVTVDRIDSCGSAQRPAAAGSRHSPEATFGSKY